MKKEDTKAPQAEKEEQLSLNDDRRVKVLSPSAMVAKSFFRNRVAVVGLAILVFMFLFSFVGGMISPYTESQQFYREDAMRKDYAALTENKEFRYTKLTDDFSGVIQAQALLAIQQKKSDFKYQRVEYTVVTEGTDFYSVLKGEEKIGLAYKDIVTSSVPDQTLSNEFVYAALKAYTNDESSFELDGVTYAVVQAILPDVFLTNEFKAAAQTAVEQKAESFDFDNVNYVLQFDAAQNVYKIKNVVYTKVFDSYSEPSAEHPLGTDKNGMDMLTRLMYGGRVSLVIGFIVVVIETVLGVVMGGLAGYFGGWVDMLIMRLVDIFYCIPSMPIIIILGAMMDEMDVDPQIRMIYLMLLLGILGWAGIARLVRGQILSLREQEFMTAAEACGVRASRRIFRHLIPNVVPQLIVTCTMGLGSTILTEATLSFLGLGVRFPFASWGNIINDVNNTHVFTTYLFIWIPAGVCLLTTVLAFNLVGDGLRDAFDPKMKR